MNLSEFEHKRIARDLAETLWRQKDNSLIFTALQHKNLNACNEADKFLVDSLIELDIFGGGSSECLLHWIPEDVSTFVFPAQNLKILYVTRPARLPIVCQSILGQPAIYGLVLEVDRDVALIYRY